MELNGSRKPSETASFTNRIGLVIGTQRQRKRQVGAGMPLLLAVQPETIESETVPGYGGIGLVKSCEIRCLDWMGLLLRRKMRRSIAEVTVQCR